MMTFLAGLLIGGTVALVAFALVSAGRGVATPTPLDEARRRLTAVPDDDGPGSAA